MRGVIYCYTSPSGKKYIGQTTNEKQRKCCWANMNIPYCSAGGKIDRAREKYGPENFKYEVFEEYDLPKKELHVKLNEREIYFIDLYKTQINGYNTTGGGSLMSPEIRSEATGKKISEAQKKHYAKMTKDDWAAFKELHKADLEKAQKTCEKPVEQYDRFGNFIKV